MHRIGMAVGSLLKGLLLALLLAGCGSAVPGVGGPPEDGQLVIAVRGVPATAEGEATLQVKLSRSERKFDLLEQVPATGGAQVVVFDNLSRGLWDIAVSLLLDVGDGEPAVTHTGSGQVYVTGRDTEATVQLAPLPGGLSLSIDIGDECIPVGGDVRCLADKDRPGRYRLHPEIGGSDRGNFEWAKGQRTKTLQRDNLPAGSYEYQIAFHDEDRRTNPVFLSEWHPFDVLPGRVTELTWHPDLGSIVLGVVVLGPPGPPRDVRAQPGEGGDSVLIAWEPPEEAVAAYNVYVKISPLHPFCLVGTTDPDDRSWSATVEDRDVCADGRHLPPSDAPLQYAVTAADDGGLESVRSPVVQVTLPVPATPEKK